MENPPSRRALEPSRERREREREGGKRTRSVDRSNRRCMTLDYPHITELSSSSSSHSFSAPVEPGAKQTFGRTRDGEWIRDGSSRSQRTRLRVSRCATATALFSLSLWSLVPIKRSFASGNLHLTSQARLGQFTIRDGNRANLSTCLREATRDRSRRVLEISSSEIPREKWSDSRVVESDFSRSRAEQVLPPYRVVD